MDFGTYGLTDLILDAG